MIGTDPLVVKQTTVNGGMIVASPGLLPRRWPLLVQYGGIFVLNTVQEITDDFCAVTDHLTYNRVSDWSVGTGVFDPYELYDGVLQRYTTSNASVNQDLPTTMQTGTTYRVTVSGQATVGFTGSGFTWGDGSTSNSFVFDNSDQTITFANKPTQLFILLTSNSDKVYSVSLSGSDVGKADYEHVVNNTFDQVESELYDIESWYDESPSTVSTDVLGWLEGYNTSQLFTVFE